MALVILNPKQTDVSVTVKVNENDIAIPDKFSYDDPKEYEEDMRILALAKVMESFANS